MLRPYRVMIVDDSAVIRGLLARTLEAEPDMSVVTTASDGRMAVNALGRYDIEVIVLDIEMPVMDGLTALPLLIEAKPGVQVIVASTLTRRGADISLRALSAGAADYLTKPTASALSAAADFRRDLVSKVRALAGARRSATGESAPAPVPAAAVRAGPLRTGTAAAPAADRRPASGIPAAPAVRPVKMPVRERGPLVLRTGSVPVPEVLAIGSSTGGPQALFAVLGALRNAGLNHLPVLVTQHMPATFTTILAEHIGRATGWPAAEAVDGEPIRPDRVYIAPGDFHMVVAQAGNGAKTLRLTKDPPENFCRPSVDPMLRSIAQVYGRHALCVILTGMGHDGLGGGQAIVAAGGAVVAQDEATSVVWGMPGAVATAGLCSAVLPLSEIAPYIRRVALRSAA